MATYPNGVYSPSAKANGQTIQASFFNDPDGEIAAVETALLNGFGHPIIVSSGGITQSASTGSNNFAGPSTFATLSVSGGSTFAGPVTFSSGVTFAQPQTFTSAPTFSSGAVISTGVLRQNSLPAFNVWSSVALNRSPGSSAGGVNFTSQKWIRGSVEHSTSAASSQVHLASSGLYLLTISGLVSSPTDSPTAQIKVFLNDATEIMRTTFAPTPSTGTVGPVMLSLVQPVQIISSGFLTMVPVANGGNSALTFGATSSLTGLRFTGTFLG